MYFASDTALSTSTTTTSVPTRPMPQCIAPFIVPSFIAFHMGPSPGHFAAALALASASFRHPLGVLFAEVGKWAVDAIPAFGIAAGFMTRLAQRACGP
jgi:hypothetical protein